MGCNCSSSALSCCPEKEYVQDKVCSPWAGANTTTLTVYTNNLSQNIVGTGFLRFDSGPGTITLNILDSAGGTIATFPAIAAGTSISFTYRRFATIQVVTAATVGQYEGEFCITTRYPVS